VRDAAEQAGGVVEVRGAVSDDELHDLYARAAVVLMPSRYEGLGLVALEAAAALPRDCAVIENLVSILLSRLYLTALYKTVELQSQATAEQVAQKLFRLAVAHERCTFVARA